MAGGRWSSSKKYRYDTFGRLFSFFLMSCCGLHVVRSRGPLQSGSDRVEVKHSKQRREVQFEKRFL